MKDNSTIEDIRKTRQEISRRCDFDPKKLVSFYVERQKTHTDNHTNPVNSASLVTDL